MFNRDGLFNRKEEALCKDLKAPVPGHLKALVPGQVPAPANTRPPQVEPAKPELVRAAAETKGSKLIVGPDIKLKGVEITDCDTLVVEGRVEAAMDSRVIQISEQGVFHGTAGIDVAEIHGRFEGELTVRKHLVIHATGKVSGKIRYGKLAIEEGGELSGDIGTLAPAVALRDRPAALKPHAGLASLV